MSVADIDSFQDGGPASRAGPSPPGPRRSTMTPAAALAALSEQTIELPSWAFGNSGTRFKVFGQPGVARDPFEKLEDAAQVHKHTGVAPRVSLHIPWDKVDDFGKLARHAADLGVAIGGVHSHPLPGGAHQPGGRAPPPPT